MLFIINIKLSLYSLITRRVLSKTIYIFSLGKFDVVKIKNIEKICNNLCSRNVENHILLLFLFINSLIRDVQIVH